MTSLVTQNWLTDLWRLIERTGWTYVQAIVAVLLSTTWFGGDAVPTVELLLVSTMPAALTLLLSSIRGLNLPEHFPRQAQVAFAVVRTFLASALGYLLAAPVFGVDYTNLRATAMAGGVAVLALVKTELASFVGNPETVHTLSARRDEVVDVTGYGPGGGLAATR